MKLLVIKKSLCIETFYRCNGAGTKGSGGSNDPRKFT